MCTVGLTSSPPEDRLVDVLRVTVAQVVQGVHLGKVGIQRVCIHPMPPPPPGPPHISLQCPLELLPCDMQHLVSHVALQHSHKVLHLVPEQTDTHTKTSHLCLLYSAVCAGVHLTVSSSLVSSGLLV